MPGIYREWGKGPYRYVGAKYKGGVAVACADVLFRDADGYDKPVSLFAWAADLAATLAALVPLVRGVSTARRLATETDDGTDKTHGAPIASGLFVFPCAPLAVAAKPGDRVTLAKQAGNGIEPQKVAITTTPGQYLGRVTEDAPVGAAFLTFELQPPTYNG